MKKERLSDILAKEEFERLFRRELLTYKEIAEMFNSTPDAIRSLNSRKFKVQRTKEEENACKKRLFSEGIISPTKMSAEQYSKIKEKRENTMLEKYRIKKCF